MLPDSPVWPEQSLSAIFQSEWCIDKEYISFAPRLRAMPDVVLHPHAHSAMHKRLQSTHDTISYIKALKACDMAEAFQIDAMLPSTHTRPLRGTASIPLNTVDF